jgi:hypothetical protein
MADDVTGAAPAADVPTDPWQMSPAQADKELALRTARFDAAQASALEAAQDGRDAEIELSRKLADRDWVGRFQRGSRVEQEDYARLTAAITTAADQDGTSVLVGAVETVPEGAVRRRDLIGTISDLARIGIAPEGIERTLVGDFSPEDAEWAQHQLDKSTGTKQWVDALLSGDPQARHEFVAYCCILSGARTL